MSSEFRPSRISLQLKLTLAHAVTLLLSISIGEVIAVAALSLLLRQSPLNVLGWGLHIVLVLIFAAAFGLVAGASINHLLSRRIRHTLEVSQAWTRGNLTLRII